MRRIVHLSDLHYGRVDARLEAPLLRTITDLAPDLVVVSGDLTQRARHEQFEDARRFLDALPGPVLTVPGNHDTPLDNLPVRLFRPFSRYKRYISKDLEPVHRDAEMVVAGVNTVNRFSWQRGKIGRGRLSRLSARLSGAAERLRVAVLHHPLEHGPQVNKRLMRGAADALEALSNCGADVVLSGHLHVAYAEPFRTADGLLFVQAGTGLSTRVRAGDGNSFNQLDHSGGRLKVVTWAASFTPAPVFAPAVTSAWERRGDVWLRA
ncbi:metallophosphoesterase family protein [Tropicimonas isoalkanivorans]|uniref:3',5'-cyclic AMP phosphodiesterase CpdA n=1 Tax=Tropicimonas isoalkanivorans TaxID=441112 RepID=A0A1I1PU20_9RHOB|nr:metallophosphoesterase family protein [Tropicimonas isoalkanivorans]SFD13255.1 3',5'-cyclic AMP phosphodiesterase CpdA [Tropicimonas isoalkanivorans]